MGRLFGKPRKRIGAEEFGRILADFAQDAEEDFAAGSAQILGIAKLEPDPLSIALVSMSAMMWAAAHHAIVTNLPGDRFDALVSAYDGVDLATVSAR